MLGVEEYLFCCDQRARLTVGYQSTYPLGIKDNKREVVIILPAHGIYQNCI